MNAQYKVNRMISIFESKEMANKINNVSPEKMLEFSNKMSEIRFDSQLDAAKAVKDKEKYKELMLQVLPIHPLKEDPLFIEAWSLACDEAVINAAVNELEC